MQCLIRQWDQWDDNKGCLQVPRTPNSGMLEQTDEMIHEVPAVNGKIAIIGIGNCSRPYMTHLCMMLKVHSTGIAGLAAIRAFREQGFDVTAYERNEHIGGIWRWCPNKDITTVLKCELTAVNLITLIDTSATRSNTSKHFVSFRILLAFNPL